MLRIVGVFKKCATFATANEKRLVPWMSGLVSGLQNRVRRFESARNLKQSSEATDNKGASEFCFYGGTQIGAQVLVKCTFRQIRKL